MYATILEAAVAWHLYNGIARKINIQVIFLSWYTVLIYFWLINFLSVIFKKLWPGRKEKNKINLVFLSEIVYEKL